MIVSRETELLQEYARLIRKWNPAINLVAPSTLDALETRHIEDSLRLVSVSSQAKGRWADIGSGGGLPGLVVAISRPDLEVCLVESDKRKCSFLRNVARELHLKNVNVVNQRIESADPILAEHVSARALAPLPLLLSYVFRHIAPGGKAWLMKGRNWQSEVDAAQEAWSFKSSVHSSFTEPGAAILEISDLRHV